MRLLKHHLFPSTIASAKGQLLKPCNHEEMYARERTEPPYVCTLTLAIYDYKTCVDNAQAKFRMAQDVNYMNG